jgi:hypothetical protein
MAARPPRTWLPRLLFRLTLGLAITLVALLLLAPWLDSGEAQPQGGWRLVALFAHDVPVRRTVLVGAVGLIVTACVFFRPAAPSRLAPRKPPRLPPPPTNVVGA